MSVIIRLQNLPLTASAMDIRVFFHGLAIPDGGVHIVGGKDGDAFIAFSSDEDARQAMNLSGESLKECKIKLLLSSRNEMFKVIEQARQATIGGGDEQAPILSGISANSHQNLPNGGTNDSRASMSMSTTGPALDPASTHVSSGSNATNAIPPNIAAMGLGGFGGQGLSPMGALNPFQSNMKMSTQQMNFMSGSGMPPFFPHQQNPGVPPMGQQQSQSPFMVSNMPFGPNQMLPGNPMAFPGMLPGNAFTGMLPGMMPPGIMNQPPPSTSGPQHSQQLGSMPSPFNQTASGIRPGGAAHAQANSPFGNVSNPGLLQQGNHGGGNLQQGRFPQQNLENFNRNAAESFNRNAAESFNRNAAESFGRNAAFGQNQSQADASKGQQQQHLPPLFNRLNSTATATEQPNRGDRGTGTVQNRDRIIERPRDRERDLLAEKGGSRRGSDSLERRTSLKSGDRRKRSRSRSRERDRIRKRSRSRSASRPRAERSASDRPGSSGRRNSTRSRSISRDRSFGDHDSRNVSGSDQDLIIDETPAIPSDAACIMLSNVANEATYRDVREFLRADARLYGVMRDYEKGTACIRLDNPADLERVIRHNGKKLYGEAVRVEVVALQVFEKEAKKHGAPVEYNRNRDSDRESAGGERDRPRGGGDGDRDSRRSSRDVRPRDSERESRHQSNRASGERCLIIEGLPVNFNGADVANITLEGVIKTFYSDIHIHEEPMDRQGRQFATAFVKFHSASEAERAVDIIGKTQGEHLKTHVTGIEALQKIRQGILPPSSPGRRMPLDLPPQPTKPLFDMDLEMESCNVMLRGIPLTMTERDIFDFFSDTGLSPKRVKFLTDAQSGNRIAKSICEFNDIGQARQAVGKDGHFFGRNIIGVKMLPPRDATAHNGFPPPPNGGPGRTLLGIRPTFPPPFHHPGGLDENPFVRALNASVGVAPIRMGNDLQQPMIRGENPRGGMRGRGIGRGRGGVRPSRFAPADSTTNDNNHNSENGQNPISYFERKGCVLAMTNIPFSANMDQIIQFLEETLEKEIPHDRIIRRYNEFQKPTGDARVAFISPFETQQALEKLKGSRMWGRLLDVSVLADF